MQKFISPQRLPIIQLCLLAHWSRVTLLRQLPFGTSQQAPVGALQSTMLHFLSKAQMPLQLSLGTSSTQVTTLLVLMQHAPEGCALVQIWLPSQGFNGSNTLGALQPPGSVLVHTLSDVQQAPCSTSGSAGSTGGDRQHTPAESHCCMHCHYALCIDCSSHA